MSALNNVILKINGTNVSKVPSSWKAIESDVSSDDSGRDLLGLMHKNMLGSASKFELEFVNIDSATLNTLSNLVTVGEYITVQLYDPLTGTVHPTDHSQDYIVERVFYVGDRSAELYNLGLNIWGNFKVNLIERGIH